MATTNGAAPPVDHDTLVEAVRYLALSGRRDALGGGVPTAALAEELPQQQSVLSGHCTQLVDEGRLVEVQGVAPGGAGGAAKRARPSYLPADHPDAPDGSDGPATRPRGGADD